MFLYYILKILLRLNFDEVQLFLVVVPIHEWDDFIQVFMK